MAEYNNNFVFRIGIKKTEIPYIRKRMKDLGLEDRWGLLQEFTDYIDKSDDLGLGEWMSYIYAKDYERIRDELLSKRNNNLCPFCKEVVKNMNEHIRKLHREEIIKIYGILKEKNIDIARKELILENL